MKQTTRLNQSNRTKITYFSITNDVKCITDSSFSNDVISIIVMTLKRTKV